MGSAQSPAAAAASASYAYSPSSQARTSDRISMARIFCPHFHSRSDTRPALIAASAGSASSRLSRRSRAAASSFPPRMRIAAVSNCA